MCFFFTEIELLNNETWKFIVENMGNWKVIELFVDPESKLGTNISQPRLTQAFASSSRDTPYESSVASFSETSHSSLYKCASTAEAQLYRGGLSILRINWRYIV
jgi:hypothetical protein